MAKKFDVYKDGEGDYAIIPHGDVLAAPVTVAALSGEVGELREVDKIINKNPQAMVRNQTYVDKQSVVDSFGPYEFVGEINVLAL